MGDGQTSGISARQGALALLNGVTNQRRLVSDMMTEGTLASLSGPDRARAQRLAATVLRQIEPLDRVLAPKLQKPPPMKVRNILRLAVTELALGGAAHGIVSEAVNLARTDKATQPFAALVNAVLRAVGPTPELTKPVQQLPAWLRKRLVAAHGRGAVAAMESVFAKAPPIDLTLRPGAQPPPGAVELPNGSWRLEADPGQISALPGYDAGDWWVQDAAAAMAAAVLNPGPGETVLDLCAAPGGKTLQLAAAGALVTALDVSPGRLTRLRENLARTGLTAEIVTADALHWTPEAAFDAVLLDAPCTATGTIRRHPDLPFSKDAAELGLLADLQARLIDRALGFVRPGGRLVICTCSLLPEEGEDQLRGALARHPGLTVERPMLKGAPKGAFTEDGGLRLRPDFWAERGGMDGFFIACLRRP
jgi:16S rRNA (cytosine967-C5)-methyltransferase